MSVEILKERGLVLLGCGKMGSAMLAGWLKQGVPPSSVWIVEPHPSDWLKATGVRLNASLPADPAIVLVAVKPQMMAEALPSLAAMGGGKTLFLSVAAGTKIAYYETVLGLATPIIRAMPNTPAAIARGITAIVGNARADAGHMDLAEALLSAVGQVVRLESEAQMDAVTAVSGSGPAYVFHLIETLAAAGEAEGLPASLSMRLAKATVAGAGALAEATDDDPGQLRVNVTSPGGTTAAALAVLMDGERGFPALLRAAVHAASERGRELGK
ncbi:MAG: pyrroline-5-carboxylate reductase [Rhodobacteraceae bacterium]|nr:pyrroline-5-carboxylate reductase [Paracoccaceae bacterium]